jgi:hypothetical protein
MKELLIGAPHRKPLDLLTNIRLGWKGLPGTNTLAYFPHRRQRKKMATPV